MIPLNIEVLKKINLFFTKTPCVSTINRFQTLISSLGGISSYPGEIALVFLPGAKCDAITWIEGLSSSPSSYGLDGTCIHTILYMVPESHLGLSSPYHTL